MHVTVLGCSGTYAAPGGACSGYVVESGGTRLWVDCGPGTLANLQRHLSLGDVDAVVVSHVHPDHWTELPVLRNALRFGVGRSGVPLVTTAEVRRAMDLLVEGSDDVFAWTVVGDGDRVEVGDLDVTFSRTDHPVETLALRVDDGVRSFGYSADTGPGWSLEALGSGLDLAACEATLLAHQEGSAPHLSARQAGESARRAGVGQLLVTHTWPAHDPLQHLEEAAAAFGGTTVLARVNERYAV